MIELYSDLEAGSLQGNKLFRIFTHDRVPAQWRYGGGSNGRVGTMVLAAEEGALFSRDFVELARFADKEFGRKQKLDNVYGWNGYDNQVPRMHTPLIVRGPSFKV